MKLSLVTTLVLFLVTLPAVATEPVFKWDRATLKLIDSGDPAKGQALAKQHKCAKCHGDTGISDEDDTPSIAGQTRSYSFKQLMNYKTEQREERQMTKLARKLSPEQMADLAAFFEAQQAQVPPKREPPALADRGDLKRLLIACDMCHGKQGLGFGLESPELSGQKIEYFVDTMTEFKEGDRENDLYGRMRFIASQLTDEEIETLAAYYSMPPSEE
jgi:cytochrome c553